MDASSARPVNHHADYPGFSGLAGLVIGLLLLATGRASARLAMDRASVSAADRVVDIGCGPGSAVRAAARRGAAVTGVDPALIMLRLARALSRNQSRVAWCEGAAEDLPVPDGSATVVWSLATVHHWKDVRSGLAEARRVLAPAGRFLVIERRVRPGTNGLASHGWTDDQAQTFAAGCRVAGFDSVRTDQHRCGRRNVWVICAVRP
jgi:ubiquinone/menaquinone biosynthesis C-methylase UbiE